MTMFENYCTSCGGGEGDGTVVVTEESLGKNKTQLSLTLSEDRRTTFECTTCGNEEAVETGVHPYTNTDTFGLRQRSDGNRTRLFVDDTEVFYSGIDEQLTQSAYITQGGVPATSRVHHVVVQAVNPPTLTENNAHDIEIEDYLDERMMLGSVRYNDSKHRTLSFYRQLDGGIIDLMDRLEERYDQPHPGGP